MLASHKTRWKCGLGQQRRFDEVFKAELTTSATAATNEPSILIACRASSHAPKSWYCGQECLTDGIKLFAKRTLGSYTTDIRISSSLIAKLVALYDVRTQLVPTAEHTEAHTTNNPPQKSFFSSAHDFTTAIDDALSIVAKHYPDQDRTLLSCGLEGFACHTPLILAWLMRSPVFVLVIRESELMYGRKEEYFSQSSVRTECCIWRQQQQKSRTPR
jgi:hypothetical protein